MAFAGFGELVGPDAEAGFGVEGIAGLAGAGDGDVGDDGVGDREEPLAADVVGLEHDPAVRRIDDGVVQPDALEHLGGGVDPDAGERPQKWPPDLTTEMFSQRIGGVAPKPFIGMPKSSELTVIPGYTSMSATYRLRNTLLVPP